MDVRAVDAGACRQGGDPYVTLAVSAPYRLETESGQRVLPLGTPIFKAFVFDDLRLDDHDHDWDPFVVEPFMTPAQYTVLGGFRGFASSGMPGLTHVGAYIPGIWYEAGDPAWAWEDGWRRVTVIAGKRSWVSVRYVGTYRAPNGRPSKSYRPAQVWPVLCDHPEPVRKIVVDAEWASLSNVE
ncbi:MAG: hypothetical protein ACREX8_20715 [Gammaproteobacteria bacterium]